MVVHGLALHAAAFLQLLSSNRGNLVNIAVHKPASQSSTYTGEGLQALAGLAVDGKTSTRFVDGSCSHTQGNYSKGWWEVDLQNLYRVDNIRILNRDMFGERLHDVRVDVYDIARHLRKGREGKHCKTHTGEAGPGWLNMTCQSPVTGQYVTITKPQARLDELTLCEVEIYEAPATFRTSHFRRASLTQIPARGEKLSTSSNLQCGTVCARSTQCHGFCVTVGEDGNQQCHILSEGPNKEETLSGGTTSAYLKME